MQPLFTRSLTLLLVCVFLLPVSQAGEHNHSEMKGDKITLNNGEKWPIDESLHKGMTSIKNALEKNISPIHYKKFTPEQYKALAADMDIHLTYLFENCKLPKSADEQLHVLLFKIIEGKEQMRAASKQRSGAITIIKVLQQYPQYFDDKNWQALKH